MKKQIPISKWVDGELWIDIVGGQFRYDRNGALPPIAASVFAL